MKKKITKTEFEALSDVDKAKYQVDPADAEQYLLIEQPAPSPAPTPQPEPSPTPAPVTASTPGVKEIVDAAIAKALKDKTEADEAERKKNAGEFENLYTELKPKHEALETQYTAMKAVVDAQIAAKKGLLSDEFKALDPDHDDPAKELAWLDNALVAMGVEAEVPGAPGLGPRPRPQQKVTDADRLKKAEEAMAARGGSPGKM